jgi:hypothetical protein
VLTPSGTRFIYAIQQETTTGGGRLVVLRDDGTMPTVIRDTTLSGDMRWSLFSNNSGTIDAQGSLWVGSGRVADATPGDIYKFNAVPCFPDCNADTVLDTQDLGCFVNKFINKNPYADCNADTVLDTQDFGCFVNSFINGCQ